MKNTRKLTVIAIAAALYYVLTAFCTIRLGNLTISVASLPMIVLAALYGARSAVSAALIGEFLNQITRYGLSVTLPLWLIPPAARVLILSLCFAAIKRRGRLPEESGVKYTLSIVFAAAITTFLNTAVIGVDGLVLGYFTWTLIFGDLLVRFLTGMITAAALSLLSKPILRSLRRSGY